MTMALPLWKPHGMQTDNVLAFYCRNSGNIGKYLKYSRKSLATRSFFLLSKTGKTTNLSRRPTGSSIVLDFVLTSCLLITNYFVIFIYYHYTYSAARAVSLLVNYAVVSSTGNPNTAFEDCCLPCRNKRKILAKNFT